jgi:hypothetical protein
VICRDLREFGIRFITPDDPQFGELASRIPLDPFGRKPELPLSDAIVAINQSPKAVLAMSIIWKWADMNGHVTIQRMPGLHSLAQLDWDSGRLDPWKSWFGPFLSGSKRLVTSQGVFGDNSDVLPPESKPTGFAGSFAGLNRRSRGGPERTLVEVQLDSVIFDGGLCAGPDEMDIFNTISSVAAEQSRLTTEAIALLQNGRGVGEVFELLQAAARHPGPGFSPGMPDPLHLLSSFGRQAVDRLVHVREGQTSELISWFEGQREQTKLRLHRA